MTNYNDIQACTQCELWSDDAPYLCDAYVDGRHNWEDIVTVIFSANLDGELHTVRVDVPESKADDIEHVSLTIWENDYLYDSFLNGYVPNGLDWDNLLDRTVERVS